MDLVLKIKSEKKYIPKIYEFSIFGQEGLEYYNKSEDEVIKKMKELGI